MLVRKVNELMLNENIKRDNWNFIRYDVVETFYLFIFLSGKQE